MAGKNSILPFSSPAYSGERAEEPSPFGRSPLPPILPRVREVIDDLRELQPHAKIVLGGPYATICPAHAASLAADLVAEGSNLDPVWKALDIESRNDFPVWVAPIGGVGVLKLIAGCPIRCTYCSAPALPAGFQARSVSDCLEEMRRLLRLGVRQLASS